ncbi:hypothetical protein EGR_00837 [Echinococcus granulosus]|uniref:Uncharacterized protein n=1 Tax=Echinococcus granulosus TaxID=6210 RepID=W6USM7_ECHGR|nr:hypothetical protein EGR_00837 [Echinococcus granulosus]EUB64293.1 hypothetical protein EGR_00837 [Echinococcus granulosus]
MQLNNMLLKVSRRNYTFYFFSRISNAFLNPHERYKLFRIDGCKELQVSEHKISLKIGGSQTPERMRVQNEEIMWNALSYFGFYDAKQSLKIRGSNYCNYAPSHGTKNHSIFCDSPTDTVPKVNAQEHQVVLEFPFGFIELRLVNVEDRIMVLSSLIKIKWFRCLLKLTDSYAICKLSYGRNMIYLMKTGGTNLNVDYYLKEYRIDTRKVLAFVFFALDSLVNLATKHRALKSPSDINASVAFNLFTCFRNQRRAFNPNFRDKWRLRNAHSTLMIKSALHTALYFLSKRFVPSEDKNAQSRRRLSKVINCYKMETETNDVQILTPWSVYICANLGNENAPAMHPCSDYFLNFYPLKINHF